MRHLVEPTRAASPAHVEWLARALTAPLYPVVHTLHRLPFRFLPYYAYFENFRHMPYARNTLNVFDELNAPQTDFISRERAEAFVRDLEDALVRGYRDVSYHVSGRRPRTDRRYRAVLRYQHPHLQRETST